MTAPFKKTKIIATVGPACSSGNILEQMIKAGTDIFRINFSHGSYQDANKIISTIRRLNKKLDTHIAILADLQGPKIRIGKIKEGTELIEGKEMVLTTKNCIGDALRLQINYPHLPKDVAEGSRILIDDGKILLEVLHTNKNDSIRTKVIKGGTLSSHKGVNLPNTKISLPCLTGKDIRDLSFSLENNIEWIALSFIRSVTDVVDVKELIRKKKGQARVIAKIEKPEALGEIDNIIDMADGIMVARGDLGVELPMEDVPLIQKILVKKCIHASKPVIIATQMMESMTEHITPTRAEANDAANAVMDGADAVMLSGETSVGKYPVAVVEQMQKIISRVEKEETIYFREHVPAVRNQTYISDSICYNACVMAKQASASAIITMTHSGYSAFRIASHRPKANIFIFTDNPVLPNTLNLLWGVRGFYYDRYESTDRTMEDIKNILKSKGLVRTDDFVINIASMPIAERGRTNMLRLSRVE